MKQRQEANNIQHFVCVCVCVCIQRRQERQQPWSKGKNTSSTSWKAGSSTTEQNALRQMSSNRLNNSFVCKVLLRRGLLWSWGGTDGSTIATRTHTHKCSCNYTKSVWKPTYKYRHVAYLNLCHMAVYELLFHTSVSHSHQLNCTYTYSIH